MKKRTMLLGVGGVVILALAAVVGYVTTRASQGQRNEETLQRTTDISGAHSMSEVALPKVKYTVLFEAYSEACTAGCQVVSLQMCAYKIDQHSEMLTVLWADSKGVVRRVLLATSGSRVQKAGDLLQSQLQAQLNRRGAQPIQGYYLATPRGIAPIYQIDASTHIAKHTGGTIRENRPSPTYFYLQDTRVPNEGIFFYWETDPQDSILSHGIYGS